jgi:polar amino acid transport system substrate-binding protein
MVVSAAVLFVCFISPSYSADAGSKPLSFATMDLEPYGFVDGMGNRPGLVREIHAAIAAKAGFEYSDMVMPLKRMLKQILRGQSDCGTFIRTEWNKSNYDTVAEIFSEFESVVVTRGDLPITRLEDLHGRLLALPRGSYVGYPVSEDPKIQRYFTNGYRQSAVIMKAGRVDAIAGSAVSLFYNLRRVGMTRKEFGGVLVFDRHPLWLHCSKGKLPAKQQERLRAAAGSLQKDGVFDRIVQSYR